MNLASCKMIVWVMFGLTWAASDATAQPFGVKQGALPELYDGKLSSSKNIYDITPPKTHPFFERYIVLSTDKTGICLITAIGKNIINDAYGSQARSDFKSLRDQIASKYGNSKMFDFLRAGSIWRDPKDFSMAVAKKERTLSSFWDKKEGSKLVDGVRAISIELKGLDSLELYLTASFDFDNRSACAVEMNSTESQAF